MKSRAQLWRGFESVQSQCFLDDCECLATSSASVFRWKRMPITLLCFFYSTALALSVQPGQGFHPTAAAAGPSHPLNGRPSHPSPLGGHHGSQLLHEEPPSIHLPEPYEAEGITQLLPVPEQNHREHRQFQQHRPGKANLPAGLSRPRRAIEIQPEGLRSISAIQLKIHEEANEGMGPAAPDSQLSQSVWDRCCGIKKKKEKFPAFSGPQSCSPPGWVPSSISFSWSGYAVSEYPSDLRSGL